MHSVHAQLEKLEGSNPQLMNDSVNKITAKKKCRSAPSCIEAKDGSIIMKKTKSWNDGKNTYVSYLRITEELNQCHTSSVGYQSWKMKLCVL